MTCWKVIKQASHIRVTAYMFIKSTADATSWQRLLQNLKIYVVGMAFFSFADTFDRETDYTGCNVFDSQKRTNSFVSIIC